MNGQPNNDKTCHDEIPEGRDTQDIGTMINAKFLKIFEGRIAELEAENRRLNTALGNHYCEHCKEIKSDLTEVGQGYVCSDCKDQMVTAYLFRCEFDSINRMFVLADDSAQVLAAIHEFAHVGEDAPEEEQESVTITRHLMRVEDIYNMPEWEA